MRRKALRFSAQHLPYSYRAGEATNFSMKATVLE